eukprot:Hpha_TRINITY_DN16188_c4_g3::TRINITY_DN16188_c4_g3_i2::g.4494::m.4494
MVRWLKLCWGCTLREGDTEQERQVKQLSAPIVNTVLVVAAAYILVADTYMRVTCALFVLASLVFILGTKLGLDLWRVIDTMLLAYIPAILGQDLIQSADMSNAQWPYVVLVLDAALTFERHHITRIVIPITLFYLVINYFEIGFRVGVYDLMGRHVEGCDCAEPPCASGMFRFAISLIATSIVMLGDFYLTRGFAT